MMTTIAIEDLKSLCMDVLLNAGLCEQDAAITTDHFLDNELSGKASHGMVRIVEAVKAISKFGLPTEDPEIVTDNGNLCVLDGKNGEAFIGDIATSAIAYGKIMVMKDKGQDVPEGVLIDEDGNPSTNPDDAYDGAILPLADYKGFALGLMVMLMSGALIGAKDIKKDLYDGDGFFIIVIDPEALGHTAFGTQVSATLETIRSSALRPGSKGISLPGERSAAVLKETLARGTVDVADKTLDDLYALAQEKAA